MFFKKSKAKSIEESLEKRGYIWVEGYKATNSNMKNKNGFQFELNKKYNLSKLEQSPYQMCLFEYDDLYFYKNLKSIEDYPILSYSYYPTENRYFKVKALVHSEVWENSEDKIHSKSIVFTEEIPQTVEALKEMLTACSLRVVTPYEYTYMQITEKDLSELFFTDFSSFYDIFHKKYSLALIEKYEIEKQSYQNRLDSSKQNLKDVIIQSELSELFYEIVVSDIADKNNRLSNFIKTLSQENISKDMMTYHILKEKDKS